MNADIQDMEERIMMEQRLLKEVTEETILLIKSKYRLAYTQMCIKGKIVKRWTQLLMCFLQNTKKVRAISQFQKDSILSAYDVTTWTMPTGKQDSSWTVGPWLKSK